MPTQRLHPKNRPAVPLTVVPTTRIQSGKESKAATRIQASFRGMRERRQRRREESAALKIQAVHRGRKVRRDLDFRSIAQKKKAGVEVGNELVEMKNRMIEMRARMKDRERKVDALKLKKIRRYESGNASQGNYFGEERKRLERKETSRARRAARR